MAREPKPWQRGYIPTVGKRRDAGWTAPEAPPGWRRHPMVDCTMYINGWGLNSATLIGAPGEPWRLYRGEDQIEAFSSKSFQTVVMWWSIEQSNQPELEPTKQEYTFAGTYRQQGKARALGMTYGMGPAAGTQLMDVDFGKIEQRVAAMYHDELAVYCQADVKAEAMTAEDIYADFAKNFKGAKP